VATFHIRIVRSPDPDVTLLPSGENTTLLTELKWPSSVCSACLVATFHIRIVRSSDSDATLLPSDENTTLVTELE
jgi:hypothetical protein